MAELDKFFNLMIEVGASDLHLASDSQPIVRVRGELERIDHPVLDSDRLKKMLYEIAPEFKVKTFEVIKNGRKVVMTKKYRVTNEEEFPEEVKRKKS